MTSDLMRRARLVAGVVLYDLPPWTRALSGRLLSAWVLARNRVDSLESTPDGTGARVGRIWMSEMHAGKVLPWFGGGALSVCLRGAPWPTQRCRQGLGRSRPAMPGAPMGRISEEMAQQFKPSAQAIRNWAKQAALDVGQHTDDRRAGGAERLYCAAGDSISHRPHTARAGVG